MHTHTHIHTHTHTHRHTHTEAHTHTRTLSISFSFSQISLSVCLFLSLYIYIYIYKHRSRNIIWFNPPYNKYISSNIGRDFLNLISKHFPNKSPLVTIFNKNIKISYSCTNNVAQIIIKTYKKKSHPPTAHHNPTTDAIVGSKVHAPYQINAYIQTPYIKPQ